MEFVRGGSAKSLQKSEEVGIINPILIQLVNYNRMIRFLFLIHFSNFQNNTPLYFHPNKCHGQLRTNYFLRPIRHYKQSVQNSVH